MRNFLFAVAFTVIGAAGALFATVGIKSRSAFIVRPKTACLTPEGSAFKVDYVGRGTIYFKILPPEAPNSKGETK